MILKRTCAVGRATWACPGGYEAANDIYGKSIPVEWRHPSGAEVNVDFAREFEGPRVPHVGWQSAGKRAPGIGSRGHILLDEVPAGRGRR